jgi:hypothetical protein
VCLVLLGVCVVVGTAGAIAMSSTDDPPHPAKTISSADTATAPAAVPAPVVPEAPPPVVVAEAAPVPVAPAPPPASPTTASAKPAASAKAKPAGSAPAALKGAKVPPNPFGGGSTLPAKRK